MYVVKIFPMVIVNIHFVTHLLCVDLLRLGSLIPNQNRTGYMLLLYILTNLGYLLTSIVTSMNAASIIIAWEVRV